LRAGECGERKTFVVGVRHALHQVRLRAPAEQANKTSLIGTRGDHATAHGARLF
jgi:hypothetical protein